MASLRRWIAGLKDSTVLNHVGFPLTELSQA